MTDNSVTIDQEVFLAVIGHFRVIQVSTDDFITDRLRGWQCLEATIPLCSQMLLYLILTSVPLMSLDTLKDSCFASSH